MTLKPIHRGLALLSIYWLSACAPMPVDTSGEITGLPELIWPSGTRYLIDETRSEFRVQLSAEGPLAAFGHPHVIGSNRITGQVVVAEPWQDSVFWLEVRVDDFLVDPPRWRAQAGLEPELPTDAIEATRANMRSASQLNAERFPTVALQSIQLSGSQHQPMVETWVSVAGHLSKQTLPVAVHWGEGELIISGTTTWRLSDLGVAPFSVFGGGLRVGDEIKLAVRLYARSGSDQSIGD